MSRSIRDVTRLVAAMVLWLAAVPWAAAGNFSVSPIRIDLSGVQPTAVVTVHNNDAEPLLIQASVLDWSQPGGEETYVASRDLLATPPVFTLAPDSEQIIRVALRRDADPARELAYRLLLAEVPQSATPAVTGLRVALRLNLPIFVQPVAEAAADLEWSATRRTDGTLAVTAHNKGLAHAQVTDFELQFAGVADTVKSAVTRYVLPGSTITWTVTLPAAASVADAADLVGSSSTGPIRASLRISGS